MGGFGLCGIPSVLIEAVLASGVTDLEAVQIACAASGSTNDDADPGQIADLAPVPLTYPAFNAVNVRMQTEHLYAVEEHLTERGIPADLVAEHFDDLHRFPPLPLETWLAKITDAYNQVIAVGVDR